MTQKQGLEEGRGMLGGKYNKVVKAANERLDKIRELENKLEKADEEIEELIRKYNEIVDQANKIIADHENQLEAAQSSSNAKAKKQSDAISLSKVSIANSDKPIGRLKKLYKKVRRAREDRVKQCLPAEYDKLKQHFPELKNTNFYKRVLHETIRPIIIEGSGNFTSNNLYTLLEENLKKLAREILEAQVKEIVSNHCNIGNNISKESSDNTLKHKLLSSIKKCMQELKWGEENADEIGYYIMEAFNKKTITRKIQRRHLKKVL